MAAHDSADVCVIVEGAYPYVVGGVSGWLQDLMRRLPEFKFSVVAIKAQASEGTHQIVPPANVVSLVEVPLAVTPGFARRYSNDAIEDIARLLLAFLIRGETHVLTAVDQKLSQLRPTPVASDILSSPAMFSVLTDHYYASFASASFHHYFWAMRSLLGGLVAVLLAPLPAAKVYHTLSTGFAGLLAARAAIGGNRALITEHGIYQLERHIEVTLAPWIGDQIDEGLTLHRHLQDVRDLWLAAFESYARACYAACDPIIALYRANSETQERLGAPADRLRIIPNGVDPNRFAKIRSLPNPADPPLVALIGRVVPIKDIRTFIRAAALVHHEIPEARFAVLGPADEDPEYAAECRALAASLSLGDVFEFAGRVDIADWLPRITVLVLTSLSEAQPLVILECGTFGVPAVVPDVGSCREMIEGRGKGDDQPGGIVTPLVDPQATSNGILLLLRNPELRQSMGATLRKRTLRDYSIDKVTAAYREIYSAA